MADRGKEEIQTQMRTNMRIHTTQIYSHSFSLKPLATFGQKTKTSVKLPKAEGSPLLRRRQDDRQKEGTDFYRPHGCWCRLASSSSTSSSIVTMLLKQGRRLPTYGGRGLFLRIR